ncbi:MAG TPA: alpha/beta hydrolase [Jiangellaceae bacterium]|nr:alpha/beta hydrolase [Jiangellaceae bacterium]
MSTPRFLALPDGVRAERVQTSRGEFATLSAGAAGPVALLVPGWTGSKEDFLAVLAPLAAAGCRAVAVDLRGQYETPGTGAAESYTLPELAADLVVLAGRLADPGQPVHLVGHSFGGLVARAAVLHAPAEIDSLTLLCSGPAGIPADRRQLLQAMADAIPALGLATTWQAKRSFERSQGAPEAPEEIERFLERRFLASDPVGLRAFTEHLIAAPDEVPALADTGVPVLVAYGVADDGWPPAEQERMAVRLGAQLSVIDGAGHSPAVERPEETVLLLTEFWASLGRPDSRTGPEARAS